MSRPLARSLCPATAHESGQNHVNGAITSKIRPVSTVLSRAAAVAKCFASDDRLFLPEFGFVCFGYLSPGSGSFRQASRLCSTILVSS